jgi:hypothetical protein
MTARYSFTQSTHACRRSPVSSPRAWAHGTQILSGHTCVRLLSVSKIARFLAVLQNCNASLEESLWVNSDLQATGDEGQGPQGATQVVEWWLRHLCF